jgi:hypothetical protein
MTDTFFVSHPFVYQQGKPFAPMQPKSGGLVLGWFWGFTGTGTTVDGVLLVAPGYESQWFSDLWSRTSDNPVVMRPMSSDEASRELRVVQHLLSLEVLNGESRQRFSLGGDEPIYIRISEEERTLVDSFLSEGLAGQEALGRLGGKHGR